MLEFILSELWATIMATILFFGAVVAVIYKTPGFLRKHFGRDDKALTAAGDISRTPLPGFPRITPPLDGRIVQGRGADITRLETALHAGNYARITSAKTIGAAVQGEGGWGKTTLAREYARVKGASYDGGLWVPAQTLQGILKAYARFAEAAFDMPPPNPITPEYGETIRDKIAASGARLLLVFDNIDDYDLVKTYVPQGPNLHIIVTTRMQGKLQGFQEVPLAPLDYSTPQSAAVDMLLSEAGGSKSTTRRAEARVLAETLGGIPLALVIAGAMAKTDRASFPDLNTRLAEIIETIPHNESYEDSIAAAVMESFDRLPIDAQTLANIIAWWAPEGITQDLFLDAPNGDWWHAYKDDLPKDLASLTQDAPRLRTAWRTLRGLSFLQGGDGTDMHRLTAAVLRHRQHGDAQLHARAAAALLMSVYPGGNRSAHHSENWPACRRLTPHVQALWQVSEPLWSGPWSRPGWEAMDTLLNQSGLFYASQENRRAELTCQRASLMLTEARLGPEHRDIPLAKGNLAMTLGKMGQFPEATTLLDDAVALDEEHRPGSEDLAASYMQQADLQFRKAKAGDPSGLPLAEDCILKARGIREALGTEGAAGVAHCWNNLGYLRRLQSRPVDEAEAYEQALTIWRSLPNIPREDIAAAAMNVGSTYLEAGKTTHAEPLLREAYEDRVDIYAQSPGHSAPQTAAKWLIRCLLTLVRKGINAEANRADAEALCTKHGFDIAAQEAMAEDYP